MDGLPSIDQLLAPDPDVEVPAPRELPVANPSPARAEPHDATAWLPVPEIEALPEIPESGGAPPHRRRFARTGRRHLPIRALIVAIVVVGTLGGVGWAATKVFDPGADVELHVDGKTVNAQTGVSTVASFLREEKVKVGAHDRVVPVASSPIENGMTVRVVRAFPVSVNFDGQDMTVLTTRTDPKEFLADVRLGREVEFREAPKKITKGAALVLRTRRVGTLFVDGQGLPYDSPSTTPRELIESLKGQVALGPQDFTTPGLDDPLPVRGSVAITRVAIETAQVDEPYSLPDEVRPDPNLDVSQSREEAAAPGIQRVTYMINRQNGAEAGRTPLSKVPLVAAKPHIMFFGTKYDSRWDKIAQCETGGNWAAGGQRYQGGLGIFFQNWNYYGGQAYAPTAGQATKFEQIIIAEKIQKDHGWGAWGCGRKLGYA